MRSPTVDISTKAWFSKLQNHRTGVFDYGLRLSWHRVLSSVLSYVMLCSDVARSGIAISEASLRKYTMIDPNQMIMVGPWAYPVVRIRSNETSSNLTLHAWQYKFDTTSISWRSLAKFLNVTSFPECLQYHSACPPNADRAPGGALSSKQLFAMMDSLVNATAAHGQKELRHRHFGPNSVAVRCKAKYIDHVHDWVLPQVFMVPWRRTNQAIYYHPDLLKRPQFSICAAKGPRPLFCDDLNTNYKRVCVYPYMCLTGVVWQDIRKRYHSLQAQFPDQHIDLTLVTSAEDTELNSGGIVFEGYRDFDMATIMRVLTCPSANGSVPNDISACTTEVVDEHRYEGTVFLTNLLPWYNSIAMLRGTAQVYFWLRLMCLIGGCYAARRAEETYRDKDVKTVLRAALSTVARMPCQGIVYGSPFPVACYVLAYLMDAPFIHHATHQKYVDINDAVLTYSLWDTAQFASVLMRNVWLLGMCLQLLVWSQTWRGWCPTHGVFGLPEYYLAGLSTISIWSYHVSKSFRNTDVSDVVEMPVNIRSAGTVRWSITNGGTGSVLLNGVIVDAKFLVALIVACLVVITWLWPFLRLKWRLSQLRTPVPFSAGELWSVVAVSVCWPTTVYPHKHQVTALTSFMKKLERNIRQTVRRVRQTPVQPMKESLRLVSEWPWTRDCVDWTQRKLSKVHSRDDDGHAMVAFINLFAMTDPIALWRLRFGSGFAIVILRHQETKQLCCVPASQYHKAMASNVPWERMDIVQEVNSKDMAWSDLLHCG
ncbi:TPA: hypothetical protein N0F65_000653 [Lagenidium giganteum]|uniref:Transmembrane protein n=1 Tax=Lagenidium giganteum TaxID=4803 RepID=A0AAV2YPV1_9STRA|nr:TPA: hypothetical protein N0F65_000653 [Lagenidium giganteum]